MAAKVEKAEKKNVAFDAGKTKTKAALAALSDIDINANKGMVAAWAKACEAVASGEFTINSDNVKALLVRKNAMVMAHRAKHNDVRSVAPINPQRISEATSILRLAELKCCTALFKSLDGYDLGQNDLVPLSRAIRKEWAWDVDAAKPAKKPAALIAFVRTAREKRHAVKGNGKGKKKSAAQRQRAKKITGNNAVGSVDTLIGTLNGFLAIDAFKGVHRAINAMINSAKDQLRPAATAFAR